MQIAKTSMMQTYTLKGITWRRVSYGQLQTTWLQLKTEFQQQD